MGAFKRGVHLVPIQKADSDLLLDCPVREEYNSALGRYLVADRAISKGTCLLVSKPASVVVFDECTKFTCSLCFNAVEDGLIVSCASCGEYWYCSEECRSKDEVHTQYECDVTTELLDLDDDVLTAEVRLIVRLLCTAAYEKEKSSNGQSISLNRVLGMASNRFLFSNDKVADFKKKAEAVVPLLPPSLTSVLLSAQSQRSSVVDEIVGLLSRCQCNAHCVESHHQQKFGVGFFPAAALASHSCSPNAVHVALGSDLHLRAIEDIGEGDLVTVTYTDLYRTTADRREALRSAYCFDCDCPRCTDRAESSDTAIGSFRCLHGCSGRVLKSGCQWVCTTCGKPMDTDSANSILEAGMEMQDAAKTAVRQGQDPAAVKEAYLHLVEKTKAVLTEHHWLLFNSYTALTGACVRCQDYTRACGFGRRVVQCVDVVYPKYHPRRALYRTLAIESLLMLGVMAQKNDFVKEAQKLMSEAVEILVVAYGENHPTVKNERERLSMIRAMS